MNIDHISENNRENNFTEAPKIIDKLILVCPEYDWFVLPNLINNCNLLSDEDKDFALRNDAVNIMFVQIFKYVEPFNNGLMQRLTDLGRKAKEAGGHFAFVKQVQEKAFADAERQKLNDEKLKYDVKNDQDFSATGTIDLMDFDGKEALSSLNKKCFDLHKGADGVSKTWSEVAINLKGSIKRSCK